MKWNAFRLKTTAGSEDIISSMLLDLGISGVEIEDTIPLTKSEKEQMFVDILPDTGPLSDTAYIKFYLEEEEDKESILGRIREELEGMRAFADIGECTIEESLTEDVDWVNQWKQYFHQFHVDDVLIAPSWEEPVPGGSEEMILRIDPGTAFGTGKHETTMLCIRALRKYVKKDSIVLDVGCGSGILGIVALKSGASYVTGTDIDMSAIEAASENMEKNGIDPLKYGLKKGNLIDDTVFRDDIGYGKYDIVTANILAEVLIPLSPPAYDCLKPGGIYITSGIIREKEDEVIRRVKDTSFDILEVARQGEWVSVTARKK